MRQNIACFGTFPGSEDFSQCLHVTIRSIPSQLDTFLSGSNVVVKGSLAFAFTVLPSPNFFSHSASSYILPLPKSLPPSYETQRQIFLAEMYRPEMLMVSDHRSTTKISYRRKGRSRKSAKPKRHLPQTQLVQNVSAVIPDYQQRQFQYHQNPETKISYRRKGRSRKSAKPKRHLPQPQPQTQLVQNASAVIPDYQQRQFQYFQNPETRPDPLLSTRVLKGWPIYHEAMSGVVGFDTVHGNGGSVGFGYGYNGVVGAGGAQNRGAGVYHEISNHRGFSGSFVDESVEVRPVPDHNNNSNSSSVVSSGGTFPMEHELVASSTNSSSVGRSSEASDQHLGAAPACIEGADIMMMSSGYSSPVDLSLKLSRSLYIEEKKSGV